MKKMELKENNNKLMENKMLKKNKSKKIEGKGKEKREKYLILSTSYIYYHHRFKNMHILIILV